MGELEAARPRKRKKYCHRWRDLAGVQRKRRFTTKRARDAFAREVADAKAAGRDWSAEPAGAHRPSPTVEALIEAYLAASERTRRPRTVGNRRDSLLPFLAWLEAREGGPAEVSVLSRSLLEDYDRHLQTTGIRKALAASSRRVVMGNIHKWWAWLDERDEYEGLIPRPRRIELPDVVGRTVHAATWGLVDDMIGALKTEDDRRAAIVLRCFGLRIEQACQLLEEDFDERTGVFSFRGELGKSRGERRGRLLPIPPAFAEEFATWQRRGGRLVRRSTGAVRRAFERAWESIRAPRSIWEGRPAHALRKMFRTELMLADGVQSHAVEYWCGRRMHGQTDDYSDPRCLRLVQIAKAIPSLAACAQGAPLARLMYARPPAEARP